MYTANLSLGIDTIEDECHVLTQCPLYTPIKKKFNFYPKDLSELASLLSNQNLMPVQATAIAKSVHSILTTNLCYTDYYKGGDFSHKLWQLSSHQDCISLALRAPYGTLRYGTLREASCPNFEPRAHARLTGLTTVAAARFYKTSLKI